MDMQRLRVQMNIVQRQRSGVHGYAEASRADEYRAEAGRGIKSLQRGRIR